MRAPARPGVWSRSNPTTQQSPRRTLDRRVARRVCSQWRPRVRLPRVRQGPQHARRRVDRQLRSRRCPLRVRIHHRGRPGLHLLTSEAHRVRPSGRTEPSTQNHTRRRASDRADRIDAAHLSDASLEGAPACAIASLSGDGGKVPSPRVRVRDAHNHARHVRSSGSEALSSLVAQIAGAKRRRTSLTRCPISILALARTSILNRPG